MSLKKYLFPKSWTENKISKHTFLINIPKEELETWEINQRKKDKVNNIIDKDGFHLKPDGRNGTIYFVENKQLCQIYFENSAVKEFDILIFFDKLSEWKLPQKKTLLENEKIQIREKLIIWLNKNKLKSDL